MAIARPTIVNDSGNRTSGTEMNAAFWTSVFNAIETGWALDSWTPSWTATSVNPAIGNGTITGKYINVGGKLVVFSARIVAGSTTTYGTGNYILSLPQTADTNFPGLISMFATDSSAGSAIYNGAGYIDTSTTMLMLTQHESAAGNYTPTSPITFAQSDRIVVFGVYFRA